MSDGCVALKSEKQYEILSEYIASILPENADMEQKRSCLLPSLYKAQQLFGFLPEEVQEYVAEKLGIHLSEVFGVVSFYSYFTMRPQGKYRISVCTGTACFIKGADKIIKKFSEELGIEEGEVSKDLSYSLDTLRCVGACGLAPVVLVNDKVYGNATPEMVRKILKDCEDGHCD